MDGHSDTARVVRRTIVIGLIAFLTVVDLFATQAILPSLTQAYQVTPAAMSFAVNASTMGMAVAGLTVAFFSRHIDRRVGILISLCVLAIPTALLAIAPDITTFMSAFEGKADTPSCTAMPACDPKPSRVVNLVQISIARERRLSKTEPSVQSGRAFNPTF